MGLDMYLTGKRYIWENSDKPEEQALADALNKMPTLGNKGKRIKGVEVEGMYWRKANAIHAWFVHHCQNDVDECQETHVSRETLTELLEVCKEVLKKPKLATQLLPPQAGFFFGNTNIDEWYIKDLNSTVEVLTKALADPAFAKGDFYYQSSW